MPYAALASFSDATIDTIYGYYHFSYFTKVELSKEDRDYCGSIVDQQHIQDHNN